MSSLPADLQALLEESTINAKMQRTVLTIADLTAANQVLVAKWQKAAEQPSPPEWTPTLNPFPPQPATDSPSSLAWTSPMPQTIPTPSKQEPSSH
jgi:hypothetical protein